MMIALAVASFLLLFVPFTVAAEQPEPPKDNSREIRNVIEQQLAAFQRDAAEAACSFASPKIRNVFRTSANFIAMVKSPYQPVYHPRSGTLLEPAAIQGSVLQRVQMLGPDNVPVVAVYTMRRQADGALNIDGCKLARSSCVYAYNTRVSVSAGPSS